MRNRINLYVLVLLLVMPFTATGAQTMSDAEVRQQMIQQSINSYSGNCPCPYNRASNGSGCGKRSAWSRPGGAEPLCYNSDISDEMVKRYRQRHGIKEKKQ